MIRCETMQSINQLDIYEMKFTPALSCAILKVHYALQILGRQRGFRAVMSL